MFYMTHRKSSATNQTMKILLLVVVTLTYRLFHLQNHDDDRRDRLRRQAIIGRRSR